MNWAPAFAGVTVLALFWAVPGSAAKPKTAKPTVKVVDTGPVTPPPFAIPPRYGAITAYDPGHRKGPRQTIVMIQDLHANIGVQKNIAAIIYRMNRISKGPMGVLVCVEGASGEGDVSLLRSLPGPVRHTFEEFLLRKAYLTGAELAATESAADWAQQQNVIYSKIRSFFFRPVYPGPVSLSPIRLWGVDDPELYRINWRAAKKVDKLQRRSIDYLHQIKPMLAQGATSALDKQLALLGKLILLRLQPKEYQEYLESRSLNPSGPEFFQQTLAAGETYYRAADQRSIAMTRNLLQKMGQEPGYTILITGGFHTQQMSAELKRQGYAHAVVTPRVEVLDQDAAYKARLREEE